MFHHRPFHDGCPPNAPCRVDRRALLRWPGIDRRALARCRHDPNRIARLVARSTHLDPHAIALVLVAPVLGADEIATLFG
jgi:hypothetical protein